MQWPAAASYRDPCTDPCPSFQGTCVSCSLVYRSKCPTDSEPTVSVTASEKHTSPQQPHGCDFSSFPPSLLKDNHSNQDWLLACSIWGDGRKTDLCLSSCSLIQGKLVHIFTLIFLSVSSSNNNNSNIHSRSRISIDKNPSAMPGSNSHSVNIPSLIFLLNKIHCLFKREKTLPPPSWGLQDPGRACKLS